MFRKTIIGFLVIIILIFVILGAIILNLNPIINSKFFKEKLNNYLKEKNIQLNYQQAKIKLFPLRLTIKNLQVIKQPDLSASISFIDILQPLKDERVIVIKGGNINISTKKKGKGESPKLKIPMIAKLYMENLNINLNGIPIKIDKINITQNRKGSFKLSIKETHLEGESYIKSGKIFVSFNQPKINIKQLLKTIETATGKKIKAKIIENIEKIEISKLTLVIIPKENQFLIETGKLLKISLPEKEIIIENIPLKVSITKTTIAIEGKGINASVEAIREILKLIGSKTIKRIFEIVSSGLLYSASFSVKLKNKKVHVKDILVKAHIKKGIVNIPSTELKATKVEGDILLSQGKLKGTLTQASIEKANLKDVNVLVDFTTKPHPISIRGKISGYLKEIMPTLFKSPIPNDVKKFLSQLKIEKGKISGEISLKIYKKTTISFRLEAQDLKAQFAEFFTFPLLIPKAFLNYKEKLNINIPKIISKNLSASDIKAVVGRDILISIKKGNAIVHKLKEEPLYKTVMKNIPYVKEIQGKIAFSNFYMKLKHRITSLKINLLLKNVFVSLKRFPLKGIESAKVTGKIKVDIPNQINGELLKLSTNANISALIEKFQIDLKKKTTHITLWCRTSKALRHFLTLNNLSPLHILPAEDTEIKGELTLKASSDAIVAAFLLKNSQASLNIEKLVYTPYRISTDLKISSRVSELYAKIEKIKNRLSFLLKGELNLENLKDLITINSKLLKRGFISSKLNAEIDTQNIYNSSINGKFLIKNASLNKDIKINVEINGRGKEGDTTFDISANWGNVYALGDIKIEKDHLVSQLDLYGGTLDLNKILNEIENPKNNGKKDLPVKLFIDYYIGTTKYKNIFIDDLTGNAYFDLMKNAFDINIEETRLCGIRLKGNIKRKTNNIYLSFLSKGKSEFEKTLKCLTEGKTPRVITGKFDYNLKFSAAGKKNPLKENSSGNFKVISKKGRIYKATVLAKILEFLTIKNLVTFKLPNFRESGFSYKKLLIQGSIKNGVIYFKNCYIDSSAMKIFFEGKWNFLKDRLNVEALIAPFTTIDAILSRVPIIGRILTGKSKTFVSIPLKVTGSSKNPKVMLHPVSVGSGLIGLMKRTIKAPVYILKPSETQ